MVNAGGDRKPQLDLLNEAKAVVASTPQSAAELNRAVASRASLHASGYRSGLCDLAPVVVRLNELVAARSCSMESISLPERRRMDHAGRNNLGNLIGMLDQMLAGLGRIDFDRARTLADQIGRPEMRVLMEIDLVQTALGIKNPSNQPLASVVCRE